MSDNNEIDDPMDAPDMEPASGEEEFSDDMSAEEFGDEDFGGEEEYGEEEWDSYDDEYAEDGEVDEAKAAKSKLFNKIIMGLGVVGALGFGGFTILGGGGGEAPAPAPTSTSEVAEFQPEPGSETVNPYGIPYGEPVPESEKVEAKKEPGKGMLNNPSVLARVQRGETVKHNETPPEERPRPPTQQPQLVRDTPPQPAPISQLSDNSLTPMPGEMPSGFERAAPTESPQPIATPNVSPEQTQTGVAVMGNDPFAVSSSSSTTPAEPPQMAMADKVDDSKPNEFSAMEMEKGPAEQDVNSSFTGSSSDAEVQALNDKLDNILIQLKDVDKRLAKIDSLETRLAKLEKSPKPKAKAARASSSNKSVTRSSPRASSSVKWVLKSAQPGRAMVSQSGSNDVVAISTGQTLAGIGKVTSIAVENGKWVVKGTRGKITQ